MQDREQNALPSPYLNDICPFPAHLPPNLELHNEIAEHNRESTSLCRKRIVLSSFRRHRDKSGEIT